MFGEDGGDRHQELLDVGRHEPDDKIEWRYEVTEIRKRFNRGREDGKPYEFTIILTVDKDLLHSNEWTPKAQIEKFYRSGDPNDERYHLGDWYFMKLVGPVNRDDRDSRDGRGR